MLRCSYINQHFTFIWNVMFNYCCSTEACRRCRKRRKTAERSCKQTLIWIETKKVGIVYFWVQINSGEIKKYTVLRVMNRRRVRNLGCVIRLKDHSAQFKADNIFFFHISWDCRRHYHVMSWRQEFNNI